MYSAKCDRAEATGNVDAKLNNAIDWGESGTHFAWWQEQRSRGDCDSNQTIIPLPGDSALSAAYQKMEEKASLDSRFDNSLRGKILIAPFY